METMPDWLLVILRAIGLLITVFAILKWLGKRQLSELTLFEYIIGIVLGSIAAEITISPNQNMTNGLIGMAVWFIVPFIVILLSMKSHAIRNITQGKGTVFIKDGKVLEDNLKKEKYTADELLEKLRRKSLFNTADVEFAVLETDGSLSVLPKKDKQPITLSDLGVKQSTKEPQTVLMDGEILNEPLATAGRSVAWLETELDKLGVSIENVFLGQVDAMGQLTVDLYDDKLTVPSPQEKPLLLAEMKKCQADLELFALQTDNTEAKKMFEKNSKRLQSVIDKATSVLQN
ncbi:DUF421 domain-containing protein [Aquibacillus sp. 3ASR75-11]|uniref:DUF421 domain-containing protein n=1 Tax=Terrihalobacillus insolitus TaxID=2950438 RepID=A0A9X3WUT4_9BACI|nr:DUF421 domain-containing protein [Terrihalobacillus insolitus]MDC3412729.1 DUF421 domain-containing protein [Terrihalobacillus insolitus]MDC3423794.1 DUF421 domain-containing protein [Terrihalobacillus insolitus]